MQLYAGAVPCLQLVVSLQRIQLHGSDIDGQPPELVGGWGCRWEINCKGSLQLRKWRLHPKGIMVSRVDPRDAIGNGHSTRDFSRDHCSSSSVFREAPKCADRKRQQQ